jgi:formylglycine-generating enzyme required for sulfatase activity
VLRGGAWSSAEAEAMLSSARDMAPARLRDPYTGFRCVIQLQSGKA